MATLGIWRWVGAFVLAEVVSYFLIWGAVRHRAAQAARGVPPAPHPSLEPVRGWRLAELAVILYHFPILVPATMLRKDNIVRPLVYYGFTPVLYSLVAWLVLWWN
jgi:hypothetical protein